MNPRTRRQRRQTRKWGTHVHNAGDYYVQPRAVVLAPVGTVADPWTTRMRWLTYCSR